MLVRARPGESIVTLAEDMGASAQAARNGSPPLPAGVFEPHEAPATPQVRAHRRVLEIQGRGEPVDAAAILADILKRDERDTSRATAPLKQAADAHLLDTTALDANAAFQAAVELVERSRAK